MNNRLKEILSANPADYSKKLKDLEGHFLLQIVESGFKETRNQGDIFFVKFEVVESRNVKDRQTKTEQELAPGETVDWAQFFLNDAAAGNVRRFIDTVAICADKTNPTDDEYEEIYNDLCANQAVGFSIGCESFERLAKRSGENYGYQRWFPPSQY